MELCSKKVSQNFTLLAHQNILEEIWQDHSALTWDTLWRQIIFYLEHKTNVYN
jgi:hypothetical protein